MKRLLLFIVPLIALFGMNGLGAEAQSKLKVVATTTIIADVARNVGGDLVDVVALIPAEADVHGYTLTPQQVAQVTDADIVLVNGMGLEEGLLQIIENTATNVYIVSFGINVLSSDYHHHDDDDHDEEPVSTPEVDHDDDDDDHHHTAEYLGVYGVDVWCGDDHDDHKDDDDHDKRYIVRSHDDDDHDDHDHGACDPHVWQNPENVMIWANNIAEIFAEADPANATIYVENAEAYIELLEDLMDEIGDLVDTLDHDARVLVTNHNFLAYFAAEFDFEVVGTVIPSASSMAQVTPQDIAELVQVIREEGVRAIFAEYSVSTNIAETVGREVGFDVAVVRLYSDSLGAEGSPASTYLDFMRYNVNAIVDALKD